MPDLFEEPNAWIACATAQAPDCRGLFFVRPTDDPEWVRQEVRRQGAHGLKCYHTLAPTKPTWEAEIPDYLPEPIVQIAHEERLLSRCTWCARAVADPSNQHWIRRYCERYPDMRLILAHRRAAFNRPQYGRPGRAGRPRQSVL